MATHTNQYHPPSPPSGPQQPLGQQQAPAGFQYYQPSQQQNHPQAKPRTFSFQSNKSHKSHKSQNSAGSRQDLHESSAEKDSNRLHTKADPTLAMNEAEPSAVAAMRADTSITPLRELQHRDPLGNFIADPDRSNPTRNRWERPLDTIRSFEAAIDGGYTRKSLYRSETDSVATWNRRSSMANSAFQPRFAQESQHGSRPMSLRGESHYGFGTPGTATARNSGFFDGQGIQGGHGPAPSRQVPRDRGQRLHPDQMYGREQPVYPMPYQDRSYETVTSAAASGNSDPAGYQTDPTSSDNSSIRRASPAKRLEPVNDYGIGFTQPQTYQSPNFALGSAGAQGGHPLPPPPGQMSYREQAPPPTPKHGAQTVIRRRPTREISHDAGEKRKSWFSRRFSKNA